MIVCHIANLMISGQRLKGWLIYGRMLWQIILLSSCNPLKKTIKKTFHLPVNSALKCSDPRPCVVTNGGTGVEEDGIMGTAQVNSVIQCMTRSDVHAQMRIGRRCALAMHSMGSGRGHRLVCR